MSEPPLKVTAEGVEVEPKKVGHRLFDLIVAGAAILISLLSLGIAVKHGLIMERLVAANSWPLLQYSTSNLDDKRGVSKITLEIENVGVGPAIVREFSVSHGGRTYNSPHELMLACCNYKPPAGGPTFTPGGLVTSDVEGKVIRAGESARYLSVEPTPENAETWARLDQERFRLSFNVCYCSVFGECWRSSLIGVDPQPVDSCPIRSSAAPRSPPDQ